MRLYGHPRSSAAQRVRIALRLKAIAYEDAPVDLASGEQRGAAHLARNPQGRVPVLIDGDVVVAQSLAILEYLEEVHPTRPLLPRGAAERARVRQLALAVACEIHPLQAMRTRAHLGETLGLDRDARFAWCRHWIEEGLEAVEALLGPGAAAGRFCHGDTPSLADVCLVPQLANARAYGCDLARFPRVRVVEAECLALPAFTESLPPPSD